MRVITCVRRSLDWTLSTKDFRIDQQTYEPVISFPRYRIDQFDEIAVEVALQYATSDAAGSCVHALGVATRKEDDALKHAVSMGAAAATLITAENDGAPAAGLLAAFIRRHTDAGIVLCGRTGSGNGSGSTGPLLAELLGWPLVSNVIRISRAGPLHVCQRESDDGYEQVALATPFVASITNAPCNMPRVPGLKDKTRAYRTPIEIVDSVALRQEAAWQPVAVQPARLKRRFVPVTSRGCRRLDGAIPEQARSLAEYIVRELAPAAGGPHG